MALYQSAVGSLQYLPTMTRPDISFEESNVGKFSSQPTKEHWAAVKKNNQIFEMYTGLWSIVHERQYQMCLLHILTLTLVSGDSDNCRLTSGYIFQIGGAGISWRSKKWTSVALFPADAEYIALSHATQEAVWLTSDLHCNTKQPTVIYEDNQAAII